METNSNHLIGLPSGKGGSAALLLTKREVAIMAETEKGTITKGPSRKQLRRKFFKRKPICFTLDTGRVVEMIAQIFYDHRHNDPIAPPYMYPARLASCDFLIAGSLRHGSKMAFIEYALKPTFGHCVILDFGDVSQPYLLYPPYWWSQVMFPTLN